VHSANLRTVCLAAAFRFAAGVKKPALGGLGDQWRRMTGSTAGAAVRRVWVMLDMERIYPE